MGESILKKNRTSKILIFYIFISILFFSSNFITPVKADAQVEILSHSSYIGSLDFYNVVGEVQNTGDQAVKYVRISATFYDSSDTVVDTALTFSTLSTILPGRKSPFTITLWESSQASKVDHYSLSVSFSTTVSVQESLQIVSHSSYIGSFGWLNIVGEIENLATGGTTYVKVIATCYDESGTVINEGLTFTNPSEIEAGQKAPFDITIYDDNLELVTSYELTVESSEFAMIPEFSSYLILLLIFPFSGFVILFYKRRLE